MAKIILKSRYLRAGSRQHSEHLIRYIAKREGVQKIDDTWKHQSATKEQQKLIEELVRDFPETKDSFEYRDYISKPSKGTASEFISRAIDDNVDLIGKRENYVSYIAKRPRTERHGAHGLFTDADVPINLSKVAEEVANHEGNVWTHIISLRREDAARLGYDNAYAWRNLLRSQAETIAENMKIPLTDLRWYAAYHDESYHPHVHMVIYSAGKEPYLTKLGIRNIKAAFARQIFRHDLLQVYVEQTNHRNELTQKNHDILSDIIARINSGSYDNPTVTDLLLKLSEQMKHHKGKKVYGYLSQAGRNLVNAVVDELAKDNDISLLYDLWYEQRDKITGTYQDTPEQRIPLSQNKEFKAVKNAVIQESLNILYDRITFEEAVSEPEEFAPDEQEPEETKTESSAPKKWWSDPDHPLFQYRKAKEYLDKNSPLYDPAEAVRWLRLSAEQGYEYAQYCLGKLYLLGNEIAQDFPQAESWLEKASDQGNSYAKYSLAKMHLAGLAAQSDAYKAVRLLRESANDGNVWAQYLLGKFYFRGEHTEKNVFEAERLLNASANQKNSQAQYLLAKLYLCEDGIPKDTEKALHWLWKSVRQENRYAQYQLGKMLLFGKDAEQDIQNGIALLSASAEQGNVYAARLLQSYYSGRLRNPSVGMASVRLLSQLARMFTDRLRKNEDGQRAVIEKKLRQKIEEKKQAHGMKMG
ncbi:MAG: SEL1-like repeat protein [Clostridiales bacterium]|nr:SEL1-like repeat protein [Clostridiales bacterium]